MFVQVTARHTNQSLLPTARRSNSDDVELGTQLSRPTRSRSLSERRQDHPTGEQLCFGQQASTPRRLRVGSTHRARPTSNKRARAAYQTATKPAGASWVTRARPKVVRIAAVVDPSLHRSGSDIPFCGAVGGRPVAERFQQLRSTPGPAFGTIHGAACTFDVMLEQSNLKTGPLLRLLQLFVAPIPSA